MTITLTVQNFGPIEAATVAIEGVTVIAGPNDAGKTTLADALRFAVSGNVVPAGWAKKDAAELVRAGMKEGQVTVAGPDGKTVVVYPKGEKHDSGRPVRAGASALGLVDYLELDDKGRARVLAQLLKSDPDQADLAAALPEHDKDAVARLWQRIQAVGWDGAAAEAKDEGIGLKRDWKTAAGGEQWGEAKAGAWTPAGWEPDLQHVAVSGPLAEAVEDAKKALVDAAARKIVTAEHVAALERRAGALQKLRDGLPALEKIASEEQERHDRARADYDANPPVSAYAEHFTKPCPHCAKDVVVKVEHNEYVLSKPDAALSKAEIEKRKKARDAAGKRLEAAAGPLGRANDAVRRHKSVIEDAEAAAKELAEARKAAAGSDADAARLEAEQNLERAQRRYGAFLAKTRADGIHRQILRNAEAQAALGDNGVRRAKLLHALEAFNETQLAPLCAAAKWKPVTLGEDLAPRYGGRAVRLCRSAQWRVSAVLRAAFARLGQAEVVILDDADVLVRAADRGGLVRMMASCGIPALVCMAVPVPERLPDPTKQTDGPIYWVETGKVRPLADVLAERKAQQKEAA